MTPIEWRRALREHPNVSPHGWAVGCAVAEFWSVANPNPRPGLTALERATKLCRNSVLAGLRNLRDLGLLTIDVRRGRANVYTLTSSPDEPVPVHDMNRLEERTSSPHEQRGSPHELAVVHHMNRSGSPHEPEEETIEGDQEGEARARPTDRFAQSLEPPAKPIPPDWVYPDAAIADAAREYGVTEADVRASMAEYVEYWRIDGGRKPRWAVHFRNHLRLQARRGRLLGAALVGTSRRQPKLKQPGATGSAFADTPPEFT